MQKTSLLCDSKLDSLEDKVDFAKSLLFENMKEITLYAKKRNKRVGNRDEKTSSVEGEDRKR